jgi:hypothetical protein
VEKSKETGGVAPVATAGLSNELVRSFVKSSSAVAETDSARSVEAIGREQQRRAVAYGRSRGQL